MDTGNNEKCIHCSRSTEFARKTQIRPEGIPNLGELCCDTSLQSTSVACRKSIVLIAAVIITVLAVIPNVVTKTVNNIFSTIETVALQTGSSIFLLSN